jgi:hypothetical protein
MADLILRAMLGVLTNATFAVADLASFLEHYQHGTRSLPNPGSLGKCRRNTGHPALLCGGPALIPPEAAALD